MSGFSQSSILSSMMFLHLSGYQAIFSNNILQFNNIYYVHSSQRCAFSAVKSRFEHIETGKAVSYACMKVSRDALYITLFSAPSLV